ncbi:serpin family protein [Endozoicomonas euniceicola]|uniref:Serpin domain-containing protein n=1 Tax=Endozoicomonas euniceicola TaxID=1234143 RepID=A0ABY6GWJ1_9GAMM|nr:serpin family protein [Endozoicomonas euniceicola]UYM17142.1 hypothetical protein NX720_04255 [Endozoicomonas euniceicola]
MNQYCYAVLNIQQTTKTLLAFSLLVLLSTYSFAVNCPHCGSNLLNHDALNKLTESINCPNCGQLTPVHLLHHPFGSASHSVTFYSAAKARNNEAPQHQQQQSKTSLDYSLEALRALQQQDQQRCHTNTAVSPPEIANAADMFFNPARQRLSSGSRVQEVTNGLKFEEPLLSPQGNNNPSESGYLKIKNTLLQKKFHMFSRDFRESIRHYGADQAITPEGNSVQTTESSMNQFIHSSFPNHEAVSLSQDYNHGTDSNSDSDITLVQTITHSVGLSDFNRAPSIFFNGQGEVRAVSASHINVRRSRLADHNDQGRFWQMVELPYQGSSFRMIAILPPDGILPDALNENRVRELMSAARQQTVSVTIPEFTVDSNHNLSGLRDNNQSQLAELFNTNNQDSVLMSTSSPQPTNTIYQRIILGTYRSTSPEVATSPEPEEMGASSETTVIFDHPFTVFIVNQFGAVKIIAEIHKPLPAGTSEGMD